MGLTQAAISRLEGGPKPKLYNVAPTLYIRVMPSGGKTWIQRVTQNGYRTDRGLGSFPFVGIEEAKRKAREQHVAVKQGERIQTKQERESKLVTFQEISEEYLSLRSMKWKQAEPKATYWLTSMERYIFPKLGKMPIEAITGKDVERVLLPIYKTKPAMAGIMRKRVSAVMKRAVSLGYRPNNPVEAIRDYLPEVKEQHFKALHHSEVKNVLKTVTGSDRMQAMTKLIVQFIIYTACRPGEARNATWDEINLEEKVWVVPAEKMKAGEEHRVPLSDQAIKVLYDASRTHEDHSGLIFTNKRGEMSTGTLSKALRRIGVESVAHGFRSSFSSWCAEQGINSDVYEAALAHTVKGVKGAYQRSKLFELRVPVMQKWADYLAA